MVRVARIEADKMPADQWGAWSDPEGGDWKGVCFNGDRIEMWQKFVQRSGRIYRVVFRSWNSISFSASYDDDVQYIGARRGAMLYFRY